MTVDFRWTDARIRRALGLPAAPAGAEGPGVGASAGPGGAAPAGYARISTDSRTIGEGDLFVALTGPRHDGHDHVAAAFAAGARGAVVSRPVAETGAEGRAVYRVDDTLRALGRLARHRRDALPATVVAIGGSVGKTSTKNLIAAAAGAGLRVHATRANENNRIGVPLTLLAAPPDTEVVVAELGTSERGEMAALAEIARPDVAVLVTVGEEHLEGLGSRDGAVEEELDLLRGRAPGAACWVGDTPLDLPDRARAIAPEVRVAGWSERAHPDLRPRDVRIDAQGRHTFNWEGHLVRLSTPGRHAVVNALLALGVARSLGVDAAAAAAAVAAVEPRGMRGEVVRVGALSVVLDCYNANPQSVAAAIELLATRAPGARKAVVLGSMGELGARSAALHREVLAEVLRQEIDVVLATGLFAAVELPTPSGRTVLVQEADPRAGYALLRERLRGDEIVLLKGSRSVALERLLPLLEVDFGAGEDG